jgi:hypothetical protein
MCRHGNHQPNPIAGIESDPHQNLHEGKRYRVINRAAGSDRYAPDPNSGAHGYR